MPPPKAFLNAKCGNAEAARKALAENGLEVEEADPKDLQAHMKKAVDGGVERILVAGGDGTIA
ncbi:MAG: diacylglycerol kinase family protein, partial [Gemmatimonadaceae bacterium]